MDELRADCLSEMWIASKKIKKCLTNAQTFAIIKSQKREREDEKMTIKITKELPEECATFIHTIEKNGCVYDVWRGISGTVYWVKYLK